MNKNRKIVHIFVSIILILVLILHCRTVLAISLSEIKESYKKDKNIVRELSDEELIEWERIVNEEIATQDKERQSLVYDINEEFRNKVDKILEELRGIQAAIKDETTSRNSDSNKENGSGMSNKDLIDKYKTTEEIRGYIDEFGVKDLSNTVKKEWTRVINNDIHVREDYRQETLRLLNGESYSEIEEDYADKATSIYQRPQQDNSERTAAQNLDDMISDADSFLEQGKIKEKDTTALQQFSSILFNIFSVVGAAVALIVGIVIGVKYMTGSIEEKADYKQMLLPYVIGCIVVFGGFGIWKIVITILESI